MNLRGIERTKREQTWWNKARTNVITLSNVATMLHNVIYILHDCWTLEVGYSASG